MNWNFLKVRCYLEEFVTDSVIKFLGYYKTKHFGLWWMIVNICLNFLVSILRQVKTPL